MYSVLSKFKICEPATKNREISNFISNYLSGRQIDFTDSTTFVFNSNTNEFTLDGITFNSVYPVDRYGIQENFNYPSQELRRREMFWSTSSFPIQTSSDPKNGFNLFGTYIAIKKISTETELKVMVSSISSIVGWINSYNSSTGVAEFKYESLPQIYAEKDSLGNNFFSIENETDWKAGTYDSSQTSNTKIGTPYSSGITSLEKYKEINLTITNFDSITKTITCTLATGLTVPEIENIQSISPADQKIRVIPLGYYSTTNNAIGIPIATSLSGMQTRSALGISSYLYYGIPYQTSYSYNNTSKDYYVRTPAFTLDFSGSNQMFVMAVVSERATTTRTVPSGFKLEII